MNKEIRKIIKSGCNSHKYLKKKIEINDIEVREIVKNTEEELRRILL